LKVPSLEGLAFDQPGQADLALLHEARHLVPELPPAPGGQLERARPVRIGKLWT
jgi:hypothetical protein